MYSVTLCFHKCLMFLRDKPEYREELENLVLEENLRTEVEKKGIDLSSTPRPIFVRKPGSQATRKPIGKFMKKHGRWSKGYRASIKAKKNPEQD